MATTPAFLGKGLTESGTGVIAGSGLATGDLRRRFDFSERFSELSIDQTPFFRLVSKVAKQSTDDPQFKYTEKRGSIHKRYAYVVGWRHGSTNVFNDATLKNSSNSASIAEDNTVTVFVATDYKSAGNIQNVSGQSSGKLDIGVSGTAPEFFLVNQLIKVNLGTAGSEGGAETAAGKTIVDYAILKVTAVGDTENVTINSTTTSVRMLTTTVIKAASGDLLSYTANWPMVDVHDLDIATVLEPARTHVVGTAYAEGSALGGQSWNDNPYSTSYGNTQIFRTEFGMTNTARATALKYEPNEWARIWRDKLIEHKWDIEQASLYGKQRVVGTTQYTQGAVDYILQAGNIFSLAHASKTSDDFLDDMSKYLDPRYNNSAASVYFCDTATYHWLLKLGSGSNTALFNNVVNETSNQRWDFATSGKKSLFGVDLTNIQTPYGDIKVTRCIALDHSAVKILGVNLKHVKYRPLVGNGLNRDTAVYVGVNSLENTGTDKRVDMILTEAGFEFSMPEAHAIWK